MMAFKVFVEPSFINLHKRNYGRFEDIPDLLKSDLSSAPNYNGS
jgi:hypothetical protein